jgi:hypothetical protein
LRSGPPKAFPPITFSATTLGTRGTAPATIISAACMYFSRSMGDTVSTSPMLSKP